MMACHCGKSNWCWGDNCKVVPPPKVEPLFLGNCANASMRYELVGGKNVCIAAVASIHAVSKTQVYLSISEAQQLRDWLNTNVPK